MLIITPTKRRNFRRCPNILLEGLRKKLSLDSFYFTTGMQINIITSFIDGSQVYGSDDEFARLVLRSPKGNGLLDERIVRNSGDRPRLPPSNPEAFCRSPNREEKHCFVAGDVRVNENQGRKHY